jgi:protein AATF/BFR2
MSLSALEIRNITRGMKKKKSGIDTKASKGRKIRYQAHEKLVGFMTSIEDSSEMTWHDSMQRELFNALFSDGMVKNGSVEGKEVDSLKIFG